MVSHQYSLSPFERLIITEPAESKRKQMPFDPVPKGKVRAGLCAPGQWALQSAQGQRHFVGVKMQRATISNLIWRATTGFGHGSSPPV